MLSFHISLPWAILIIAILVILGWKIIKFAIKLLFIILIILAAAAILHYLLPFI